MPQFLTAEMFQTQYESGRRDFRFVEAIGILLSKVELPGVDLTGANLVGADFREANLEGACLKEANLFGAILNSAKLGASLLEGANLQRAQLDFADLRYATYNRLTQFSEDFDPISAGMQAGASSEADVEELPMPWMYRGRRPSRGTLLTSPTLSSTHAARSTLRWVYRGRVVLK